MSLSENTPETWENIKTLRDLLKLDSFDYLPAHDFSYISKALGHQGHSSTYSCHYCLALKPLKKAGQPRTLEHYRQNAIQFRTKLDAGEIEWKDCVDYFNCCNEPLFNGPEGAPIIFIIPPDELHLMLRITNRLITLLNDQWSAVSGVKDRLYVWLEKNNVQRQDYRDRSLNGPSCKLFLEKKLDALKRELPRSLRDYVKVFKAFDKVKKIMGE